ncbi:MAG TPA: protein kinase [Pseudonocardia sp.]|nr:protein kinase [Pseudonocardia sp.]
MSDDWPGRRGWPDQPGRDQDAGDLERTRVLGPPQRFTGQLPAAGEPVLAGRYRLEQPQGAAAGIGFHQATDQRDGRPVGVTLFTGRLDETGARRFLDQARPLTAVHHPGLVAVLDVGVERGQGYLVRERVDGHTLRAELSRGPLPAEEVARIGAQAAAALAEAHDHGLSHQDISPDTVVLGRDGRTRVADLGVRTLARTTGTPTEGTEAYWSPEQLRREPIGPPTDVYALGLTLLEALTGRPAYPGGREAASARLTRPPTVPNNVPAPLARALLAMTAIAAADRGSARQSASMLNSAASGPSFAAIPEEPVATSPARRVALIALPVLVLLMLVAGLVAFTGGTDTPGGSSTSGGTASPSSTHSPRSTRTRTPAAESTGEPGTSSEPSFNLPELPKASDVERAVTDKVKEQAKRTLTEKAQDAWKSFTDWLSGLF